MVAMHGGEVNLVEITEDKIAILSFGGGCIRRCAQVDITLKHGVKISYFRVLNYPESKT